MTAFPMSANNETGVLFPLEQIAGMCPSADGLAAALSQASLLAGMTAEKDGCEVARALHR